MPCSIRIFVRAAVLLVALTTAHTLCAQVPTIHVTDLYYPHADPDDHWDLANQYALACSGDIQLEGILIDFTRTAILSGRDKRPFGDPDVVGVAMMNMLTGRTVPVMIGSSRMMQGVDDSQADAPLTDQNGVLRLLAILRRSPEPVVIHITGTSRDVALAANREAELFRRKCKAVYLNAGTALGASGDCNAKLDPAGYTAIFDLPCPVYWLPCYHGTSEPGERARGKGEYSSWYVFRQGQILPDLSPGVQNFLAYMFRHGRTQRDKKERDIHWARYLIGPVEQDVIDAQNGVKRNMWCTAGFLHAAGKTVTGDGTIVPLADAPKDAVFTFKPVRIDVKPGRKPTVEWTPDPQSQNRFLLHVTDQEHYGPAMGRALKTTLEALP